MASFRDIVKKVIFKLGGESGYRKAYVKGKVSDINKGINKEEEIEHLSHFIMEESTVLDIGANYGHYSIEMSKLCSNGIVHAFEPVPFTFDVLTNVVSEFNVDNIKTYNLAISDSKGKIEMTVPLLEFGAPNTGVAHIGNPSDSNSKSVSVNTDLLDKIEFAGKIDFIKIDIEGHEPEAFAGMKDLIAKNRPVILIEFSHVCLLRAGHEPDDFADLIQEEFNYKFAQFENNKLTTVKEKHPSDGYYFLIPTEKLEHYLTKLGE